MYFLCWSESHSIFPSVHSSNEVFAPSRTLTDYVSSTILSRTSKDATQSLQTQLETAERVLQLTRDVGTLAESAKEAFKVSNQISEVLKLVTDYTTTVETVQSISRGISALAARSQGMFYDTAEL